MAETTDKAVRNRGWSVAFSAAGVTLTAGIVYAWSVISNGLIAEYNWTSTEASLPYTTMTIAFVAAMVVFGRVQDIYGPQICTVLSGILVGCGMILSGLVKSPWLMAITFGAITGSGIGITNICTTPPALKWFPPDKKGLISGIVVTGAGLAPVLYSPASNFLIIYAGVAKTFIYIGIFALVVITLLAKFIVNPPAGYKSGAAPETAASSLAGREITGWQMIKTPEFCKMWLMFSFSAAAGLMIIAHAAIIAKVQVNWEGGYLLLILLALFNACGRLSCGAVSDKIGRFNLMRLVFILQAINMFIFSRYLSVGLLSLGMAITGLCYGALFSVFPAATADLFGLKNFGANFGLLFTAWGLSGIIGPLTAARVFDVTGAYNRAYLIAGCLVIISLILGFTFKKRQTA